MSLLWLALSRTFIFISGANLSLGLYRARLSCPENYVFSLGYRFVEKEEKNFSSTVGHRILLLVNCAAVFDCYFYSVSIIL